MSWTCNYLGMSHDVCRYISVSLVVVVCFDKIAMFFFLVALKSFCLMFTKIQLTISIRNARVSGGVLQVLCDITLCVDHHQYGALDMWRNLTHL